MLGSHNDNRASLKPAMVRLNSCVLVLRQLPQDFSLLSAAGSEDLQVQGRARNHRTARGTTVLECF